MFIFIIIIRFIHLQAPFSFLIEAGPQAVVATVAAGFVVVNGVESIVAVQK